MAQVKSLAAPAVDSVRFPAPMPDSTQHLWAPVHTRHIHSHINKISILCGAPHRCQVSSLCVYFLCVLRGKHSTPSYHHRCHRCRHPSASQTTNRGAEGKEKSPNSGTTACLPGLMCLLGSSGFPSTVSHPTVRALSP